MGIREGCSLSASLILFYSSLSVFALRIPRLELDTTVDLKYCKFYTEVAMNFSGVEVFACLSENREEVVRIRINSPYDWLDRYMEI